MDSSKPSKRIDNGITEYLTSVIQLNLEGTLLSIKSACDEGGYMFAVELPGLVRCSFRVLSSSKLQERVMDNVAGIKRFILEDYLEARLMTGDSVLRFLNLPGKVEFLDEEEKYTLMHRVAIIAAQERFGAKNVYSAEFISEKTFIFHTREGQFSLRIDDFKYNLKDTLETMSHYMRKPLRKRYDRECNEKKSNQG